MGALALIVLSYGPCEADPAWYDSFLPDYASGWQSSGPVALYDASNIFDYMDGAGELYLAYGFRALAVREYTGPAGAKMTAEVYRMTDSREAFGVYSAERSARHPSDKAALAIGRDRDFEAGMLRFWKGDYFVRILADKQTPESSAAVLALGRMIADHIPARGEYPVLLKSLPKVGLVPTSVRYLHKHTVLNYHYYLSDANLLDLGPKTEAVLAQYVLDKANPRLLIVRYPTAKEAGAAYSQFVRVYLKREPASGESIRVQKVEQGKHVAARVQGASLKLVFDAGYAKQCRGLLGAQ
ncbi:MAG: hypothetical protein Q7T82_11065 [Armatimonadota bacterium]|nr:hypothetical protein [Armatimonadota bacterium]